MTVNTPRSRELPSIAEAMRQLYAAGRAVWPGLSLDSDTFGRYLARHADGGTLPSEEHAADMYLACACAHGVKGALEVFEGTLTSDVVRAVASIDSSRAFVEDTLQVIRERLLVRRGDELGKIAEYAGRASLKSWLCAVAVRTAITLRRRKGERGHWSSSEPDDRRLAQGGPEFEYLRGRYKEVFEDAVRTAVEQLATKQRMLLRLNLVERMSIDKLAAMYKVGRSTAARWLTSARRALLEHARRELHRKLRLTSTELDGLAADMRSQLDISIHRLFASSRCEQSTVRGDGSV